MFSEKAVKLRQKRTLETIILQREMTRRIKKSKNFAVLTSVALLSATLIAPHAAFADAASDLKEADAAVQTANDEYDAAVAKQSDLASQIDSINNQLVEKQSQVNIAIRDRYVNGSDAQGILKAVATGGTISDIINAVENYTKISEWRVQQINELNATKQQLETAKREQDTAVEQANNAKQEAIDAQGAAREAVEELKKKQAAAQAAASVQTTVQQVIGSGSTARAATSSTWSDAESAKAFIVGKESGGRYNAQNGKYYGAYQLSLSYLNGDLSPENQDRVAENYVNNRYGGWIGAAQFWQAHGWY